MSDDAWGVVLVFVLGVCTGALGMFVTMAGQAPGAATSRKDSEGSET